MAQDIVERWEPSNDLNERPVSIFDATWQGGQQRLIVNVKYASDAREDDDLDALVIFHDVWAYRVFDENMDTSGLLESPAGELAVDYPYGGGWPFLEVRSSTWVARLVERHGGWNAVDFRHLVISARNMHLHVACRNLLPPAYLV